jgi:hypothetical protein
MEVLLTDAYTAGEEIYTAVLPASTGRIAPWTKPGAVGRREHGRLGHLLRRGRTPAAALRRELLTWWRRPWGRDGAGFTAAMDGVRYCPLKGPVQPTALLAFTSRRCDPSAAVRQFSEAGRADGGGFFAFAGPRESWQLPVWVKVRKALSEQI